MGNPQAFWSYVHADNEAESERIVQLAHDVVAEFELLTGDTISLKVDSDILEWGDDWRTRIDEGLSAVAFFIAVLSPRYFQSAECRRELNYFARRADDLGISELVLPLLYVDVPSLHDEEIADELVALVKKYQWVDWREVRFADRTSGDYRRAVSQLASRLVRASKASEAADVPTAAAKDPQDDDDTPGVIDLLAAAEEAMPRFTETLTSAAGEIDDIGELMRDGTSRLNESEARGARLAGRLRVLREVARQLQPRSDRIAGLAQTFTAELYEVDQGIRTIILRAPQEIQRDASQRDEICAFFEQVHSMVTAAEHGLGSLREMVTSIEGLEGLSRDLRAPLRTLKQGLTVFVEGEAVIAGWAKLVNESSVDCSAA